MVRRDRYPASSLRFSPPESLWCDASVSLRGESEQPRRTQPEVLSMIIQLYVRVEASNPVDLEQSVPRETNARIRTLASARKSPFVLGEEKGMTFYTLKLIISSIG